EFMSPEQLSGDTLDPRSDIYSLALVLFKMMTGKLPFAASTVQETMVQRLTDEPLKLAAARPDRRFPPGLQATLDAALTRSPVDRYRSAAKFASDVAGVTGLTRGSSGIPLPVTRGDAEERTKLLVSLSAAALQGPPPVAAALPKQRSLVPVIVGAVVVLAGAGAAMLVFGGGQRGGGALLDTVPHVPAAAPPDTAMPRAPVQPARRTPARIPAVIRRKPRIELARSHELLDDLLFKLQPRTAASLEDPARHTYTAPDVADGMGGAAAGELASEMATETVCEQMIRMWGNEKDVTPQRFAYRLKEAVEVANSHIHSYAKAHPEVRGMGTTTTAVGILNDHV